MRGAAFPTWRPAAAAVFCTLFVLAWQSSTVEWNYDGDWTALFHTGAFLRLPSELSATYRFPGGGYDGQFYRIVAHDPALLGSQTYVDNPRLRWRRILEPAAAFVLAAGQHQAIDVALIAVNAVAVALGTWWLAQWLVTQALPPWWAMAFPLLPAVLVSTDRMTIDTALAVLCSGFVLYEAQGRPRPLAAVLTAAPLARETGLGLLAAWLLYLAIRREWGRAARYLLCAVPAIAWFAYVDSRTAADQTTWVSWAPYSGLVTRLAHPFPYAISSRWLAGAAVLDYIAAAAIAAAVLCAVALLWNRRTVLATAAAVYAIAAAPLAKPDLWSDAYNFARTQTPLLFLVALAGVERRCFWAVVPLALTLPRPLYQFGPQWKGILHGLVQR